MKLRILSMILLLVLVACQMSCGLARKAVGTTTNVLMLPVKAVAVPLMQASANPG